MNEESELKKDNTQTHTCCPKCGCVHVGGCKFQLTNRPTPPVQTKTAEEILHQYYGRSDSDRVIIWCMEQYAAQVNSAKSVEVEEAAKEFVYNGDLELEPGTIAWYKYEGFLAGSNWQQQKQAETISRLSGDMEWIAKFCNDPECKRLAKEALIPHNKDTQKS